MRTNYAMIIRMKRFLSVVLLVGLGLAVGSSSVGSARGSEAKVLENTPAEILAAHNAERKKVSVPPLKWDAALAKTATEWAHHLCRSGKKMPALQHRPRREGSPGENLWAGANSESSGYGIDEAVQRWAEEAKFYDGKSGQCQGGVCGHYTQLVWRDTTHVGCGTARCAASGMTATVWVCNYRPAGNFVGEKPF